MLGQLDVDGKKNEIPMLSNLLDTINIFTPTLHTQLASLPWADVPITDTQHDRAYGREEKRTLKVVTIAAGIGLPYARQAIQITRKSRWLTSKRWSTETVYAIIDRCACGRRPAAIVLAGS